MNCYYVTVVDCLIRWHLIKFNTTVAVNFSNSTSISTLPGALIVNLQKILYNSQASVGDSEGQYTIILFTSNIFFPTILNYLNDRERGRHYLL